MRGLPVAVLVLCLLQACGDDAKPRAVEAAGARQAAQALTDSAAFDDGMLVEEILPPPSTDDVTLIGLDTEIIVTPGESAAVRARVSGMRAGDVSHALVQFEGASRHFQVSASVGRDGEELELGFSVGSDTCDELCNTEYRVGVGQAVQLEDETVSSSAGVAVVVIDCSAAGDEKYCGDVVSPDEAIANALHFDAPASMRVSGIVTNSTAVRAIRKPGSDPFLVPQRRAEILFDVEKPETGIVDKVLLQVGALRQSIAVDMVDTLERQVSVGMTVSGDACLGLCRGVHDERYRLAVENEAGEISTAFEGIVSLDCSASVDGEICVEGENKRLSPPALDPSFALKPSTDGGVQMDIVECETDADCDDRLFCNGIEYCSPTDPNADGSGCVEAILETCREGEICDEGQDLCIDPCEGVDDLDGDGHLNMECGGDDCDDADPDRYPGNLEVCDLASHDEDCDPATFGSRDVDNDGFSDDRCCNVNEAGDSTCGNDCRDGASAIHPGASESCNRTDDDCDGMVDEGAQNAGFADLDGDGHGDANQPVSACAGEGGVSMLDDDCDDDNPEKYAGAAEICDAEDNDCDQVVDEDAGEVNWYRDLDGDGFGDPASGLKVSCVPLDGYSVLGTDCDDMRAGVSPAAPEVCNGRDDDCNGLADYQIVPGNGEDDDGDGFADGVCSSGSDCDDNDRLSHPGAAELCDGRDNDCNGSIDEEVETISWYADLDGDGHGDAQADPVDSCSQPAGHAPDNGDCDDSDPGRGPGILDICNAKDDDCDGVEDEDSQLSVYFPDVDVDGYGDAQSPILACFAVPNTIQVAGDCDDMDIDVNPMGVDVCDGVDNDCDDLIDEGLGAPLTCGQGICEVTVSSCFDGAPAVCIPNAPALETCNLLDDDCDGVVDNEPVASDSCGDPDTTISTCVAGNCQVSGCTPGNGDCNGIPQDGCEVDLVNSAVNCGACGHGCRAGDTCVSGVCQNEPVGISAGESHTCVRLGSGEVYCWGNNSNGQIGDGTRTPALSAVNIATGGFTVDIAVGQLHSCAVLNDQSARCWGENGRYQVVNDAGAPQVLSPRAPYNNLGDILTIALGAEHTCARRSNGQVACWGRRCSGRLGQDTSCSGTTFRPAVGSINNTSHLDLGSNFATAMRTNPTVEMVGWGYGALYALGDADNTSAQLVGPMLDGSDDSSIGDVLAITSGTNFSCLVRSTGQVQCTGNNDQGQMGDGMAGTAATKMSSVPNVDNAVDVSGDFTHACALLDDGTLSCWGRNNEGQLGYATMGLFSDVPMSTMPLPSRVLKVATGAQHTCAILDNRRIACWGNNSLGQLGTGDLNAVMTFSYVTGLP